MADLGKIGITPGGEYNSETTYEPMTIVTYGDGAYMSIVRTQGHDPTDTDCWMCLVQNVTVPFTQAAELENIESGEPTSTIFGKLAKAISDLMDHIKTVATSTIAGHVKLSNSSAITEAGQYALDAVEKNASVDGTLANQISKIDSRLNRKQTLSYINCAVRAIGGTSIKICNNNIAAGKIPPDVNYIPVIIGHEKTIDAEDHIYCENDVWYIRTNVTQTITIRFYELIYD